MHMVSVLFYLQNIQSSGKSQNKTHRQKFYKYTDIFPLVLRLLSPTNYLLQRVLTFASKHTPCLNTSSLCMGILKSCASSTKLYLVTPGIAHTVADSLPDSSFTTALETRRDAHPPGNRSHASLRRSSRLRRADRRRRQNARAGRRFGVFAQLPAGLMREG